MDKYFEEIIKLSKKSLKYGDVPIGAIIVKDGVIIGKGYNTREKRESVLGHAEINAINMASKKLNNWNLNGSQFLHQLIQLLDLFRIRIFIGIKIFHNILQRFVFCAGIYCCRNLGRKRRDRLL